MAFLIEATGQRLSCLLNPESLVWRRRAGLRRRRDATGVITGQALDDDPMVATGGGMTEIDLDLLFDVAVADELTAMPGSFPGNGGADEAVPLDRDVRNMTQPLWNLAENTAGQDGFGVPPLVRFVWGRAWNVPGLVVAVAERLERFTAGGLPQRSWLRLRLRRVSDGQARLAAERPAGGVPLDPVTPQFDRPVLPGGEGEEYWPRVEIPVDPDGLPRRRPDQVAADHTGNPADWRLIAEANDIANPLRLPEGTVLRLPPPHRAAPA